MSSSGSLTFRWDSDTLEKAHVHCVIVGAAHEQPKDPIIFDGDQQLHAAHINGYLLDAPDVFIHARGKRPLTPGLPVMSKGSQPTDGGNLILSEDEANALIADCPEASGWVRRFMMSVDLLNGKIRYCLWLVDVSPSEIRQCPEIMKRLEAVRAFREKSPTASVRKDAATPGLFTQIRRPHTKFLVIPRVTSENRRYVPMAFLDPDIIAGDKLQLIEDTSLYHFGVLTSNVHMAWMRVTAGRLKSDYSYSPAVYNNFPWSDPTPRQKEQIEQTAQAILDARALYQDATLADLYDESTMPVELIRAHHGNNRAVMDAYGMRYTSPATGKEWDALDAVCVTTLMDLYPKLVHEQG